MAFFKRIAARTGELTRRALGLPGAAKRQSIRKARHEETNQIHEWRGYVDALLKLSEDQRGERENAQMMEVTGKLASSRHPMATRTLHRVLAGPHYEQSRLIAARALRETQGKNVVKLLESRVVNGMRQTRQGRLSMLPFQAAVTLAQLEGEKAASFFRQFIINQDKEEFRLVGMTGIAHIATPTHIPLLAAGLQSENSSMALTALNGLIRTRHPDTLQPIANAMASRSTSVQYVAQKFWYELLDKNKRLDQAPLALQRLWLIKPFLPPLRDEFDDSDLDQAVCAAMHAALTAPHPATRQAQARVAVAFRHFRKNSTGKVTDSPHVVRQVIQTAFNPLRAKTFSNPAELRLYYAQLRAGQPERIK